MKNSGIKLSLCIPTYNRADTLEILLESIYLQIEDYKDEVEVCISDNASMDSTEDVVKRYFEKLNIRYDKKNKTVHPVINWDYAINKMPSGSYVLMLGDDDILINGAIGRMLNMIEQYESDYYYLNHISAQININREAVYSHNCRMEYCAEECECYNQTSGYVEKWEQILNFPGKYQDMNMLYIGNYLMRRGLWNIDVIEFEKKYIENANKPMREDTLDYYYSEWSPHITVVANLMMGKRCFYCAEPMICQGMGMNTSDIFQVKWLLFIPRWIQMFSDLHMDSVEFNKYVDTVTRRGIDKYVNLLLYKPDILKQHPYCSDFIYALGNQKGTLSGTMNLNEMLNEIIHKLTDKKNDYYFNMIDNYFQRQISELLEQRNGRVVLWGTGDVGKKYIHAVDVLKQNIDFVVDGNVTLQGKVFEELNLPIYAPERIKNEQIYMIIIASVKYEMEIENTLKQYGCKGYYKVGSKGITYISEL